MHFIKVYFEDNLKDLELELNEGNIREHDGFTSWGEEVFNFEVGWASLRLGCYGDDRYGSIPQLYQYQLYIYKEVEDEGI